MVSRRMLAAAGTLGTAVLMAILAVEVSVYLGDPGNDVHMAAMGALSTGLMVFLVVFAAVYTRSGSNADAYRERFLGECPVCETRFGEDGVCPRCGRRRPGGSGGGGGV